MDHVVFGTMTFGPRSTQEEAKEILEFVKDAGVSELDTALMYGGGKTEEILGNLDAANSGDFVVATKANPFKTTPQPVEVGLSTAQVRAQLEHSLQSLKANEVDLFYLHAPDHSVDIKETLAIVDKLHKEGKFRRFGLSNFSAWQVAQICEICQEKGYVQPTVYQGMYNGVTRQVELELFPCLRHYNISFYAYNPLAGGLLTGRYSQEEEPKEGRFTVETMWGKIYRQRFWKKHLFDTVGELKKLCEKHDMTVTSAALRWVLHHSQMSVEKGDKIIIGASCLDYCKENITACQEGPLPQDVVDVFEEGWKLHQPNCPNYFR
eukprot:m.88767 g.88767  ORF g.88767 m.88767 type:complete len:321 (-) comp12274_c0_seq2:2238-3200(-)